MVARFIHLFFCCGGGGAAISFLFVVRLFAARSCVLLVGFVWLLLVLWL